MSLAIHSTASADPSTLVERSPAYARRVLLDALFLGGLADALLRDGPGLGLALWMAVFAVMLVHLVRTRGERFRPGQLAWLAIAVLFATTQAWRDSPMLHAGNFLAMLLALAILGATLMRESIMPSILGQRVRDLAVSLAAVVKQVMGGVISLTFVDSAPSTMTETWRGGRVRSVGRAALLTLPILLVFGLLLGSADPLFERLFSLPSLDWGLIASHVVVAGFFTWVVGGWLRGSLIDERPRARPAEVLGITLSALDVTVILGGLVALFALFVGVQVGWLFGGERLVRSTTGLSYAEYARHGFFELVWVSLLVLPVVLGTRAAIRDGDTRAITRHRRLSFALIVLLAGIMVSALGRMGLYVHYYGLSSDRLFASVFMGWLALVFAWFASTVLRGHTRDFVAGMTITGFATLGALNVANPDAIVARVNLSRARQALMVHDSAAAAASYSASPIDYSYLTTWLRGDATDAIVAALLAPPVAPPNTVARDAEVRERCDAVRNLLRVVARESDSGSGGADWRSWNADRWRALSSIRGHESDLRRVTCSDAAGEMPFGDRDSRSPRPGEQWYATASATSGLSGAGGRQ